MPVYKHTNVYILSIYKAISGFLSIIYIIWLWFFFISNEENLMDLSELYSLLL